MLVFSFIMSIIFAVVLVTFIISILFILLKQNKLQEEYESQLEEVINGFKTLDLGGASIDREQKEKKK